MRERSNNVGGVAGVALALWLGACSGDGQSNGTTPQDVITAPDVASDTAAPEVGPDTVDPGDTAASDTEPQPDAIEGPDTVEPADTVEPGWDVGVVLPTPPVGPACAKDADCSAPTGRCDPLYHVCVECVVGTECGWNRECKNYHCEGPGGQRCLYDWDCLGSPDGHACKPLEGICTQCYENWHCEQNEVCENNACVPGTWPAFCVSTLDCPVDQVCSRAGHCVQCAGDEDCGAGTQCRNFDCVPIPAPEPEPPVANLLACTSDKDCRDYDALCNKTRGFCDIKPLCSVDDDCPTPYHCDGHVCRPDRCYPAEGRCYLSCRDFSRCTVGELIVTCTPDGRRFAEETAHPCEDVQVGDCWHPQYCSLGASPFAAACANWQEPLLGCRDAYLLRDASGIRTDWCPCRADNAPDYCVETSSPP